MRNSEPLHVLMGGLELGTLRTERGRPVLTYDEAWTARADGGVPLSLSMPMTRRVHEGSVVRNFLCNLLPDSDATLTAWARKFEVPREDPLALLSHVGEDCAGAVQFVREDRLAAVWSEEGSVEWLDDEEIGRRLALLRVEAGTSGRARGEVGQFSLAGAQPKTALILKDGRWGVPSGRTPTTHILKPPSLGYDGHLENEHLCLAAAARLGLRAARSGVMRFGEEVAIVVKRFDRVSRGGRLQRVHQEDLCQALGVHPTSKYEFGDRGPTIRDVVHKVLRWSSDPAADKRAFMAAVAYNHVVGGPDAHAKNYSVQIAPGGLMRLAPLYDVASILPYEDVSRVRMAMSVGGAFGFDEVGPRQWTMEARAAVMPVDDVMGPLRDVVARAPDAFADSARAAREAGLEAPVLDELTSRVAERCAALAKVHGMEPRPSAVDDVNHVVAAP